MLLTFCTHAFHQTDFDIDPFRYQVTHDRTDDRVADDRMTASWTTKYIYINASRSLSFTKRLNHGMQGLQLAKLQMLLELSRISESGVRTQEVDATTLKERILVTGFSKGEGNSP